MKTALKILSVLEIIIGILAIVVCIATLVLGKALDGAVEQTAEVQALVSLKVSAILGGISGLFNLGCGVTGLRGAAGNRGQLSIAVLLGWVGLIIAVISGIMTLVGDVTASGLITALCSAVVPVLFLISAKSVKNSR